MADEKQLTRTDKIVNFLGKWIAILSLATLSVAGLVHLIGGVDPTISYPIAVIAVGYLVKEIL